MPSATHGIPHTATKNFGKTEFAEYLGYRVVRIWGCWVPWVQTIEGRWEVAGPMVVGLVKKAARRSGKHYVRNFY